MNDNSKAAMLSSEDLAQTSTMWRLLKRPQNLDTNYICLFVHARKQQASRSSLFFPASLTFWTLWLMFCSSTFKTIRLLYNVSVTLRWMFQWACHVHTLLLATQSNQDLIRLCGCRRPRLGSAADPQYLISAISGVELKHDSFYAYKPRKFAAMSEVLTPSSIYQWEDNIEHIVTKTHSLDLTAIAQMMSSLFAIKKPSAGDQQNSFFIAFSQFKLHSCLKNPREQESLNPPFYFGKQSQTRCIHYIHDKHWLESISYWNGKKATLRSQFTTTKTT